VIRIVLLGRTGNILFQYALGRVLAKKHGVPLVLDASWYNTDGWNEISHFLKLPIQAKVIRPCSLASRALRNLTGKHFWEFSNRPFLKESANDQSFDPSFLEAPADCALFGYFQIPRYFESIADELRSELNDLFKIEHSSEFRGLTSNNSVAVHVRRGDYLNHACFQICDEVYYQKSMNDMRQHVSGAQFYIFSDDPRWCEKNFKDLDVAAIIGRRYNSSPLHDLHLMSLASHHIIANSSYSWWAAWLGKKPDQFVIMPDRWYSHGIKAPIEEKKWS
jgi:hypothetical protein